MRPAPVIKRKLNKFIAVAGLLFVTVGVHQSFAWSLFDSSRDWKFVQTVGGAAVSTPHRDERKHVILPIRCSAAGETVTQPPTTINSGLAFDTPKVRINGTNIFLTFRTTLPGKLNAQCPPADLGKLKDGSYAVFYRSPDGSCQSLGNIHTPDL